MNLLLTFFSFYALCLFNYCTGKEIDEEPLLRLGLIGLDTSHVIAFTSRLNEPDSLNHVPGARVIAAFKGGSEGNNITHFGQVKLKVFVAITNQTKLSFVTTKTFRHIFHHCKVNCILITLS